MTKPTQALRQIPAGEQFSAKNEYVAPRKVKATFAIRRSESEPRYEKTIEFNFAGLSDEELIQMAMYSAKVRAQSILRSLAPDVMLNPTTMAQVNVKQDLLEAPKAAADPISSAIKSLMKATGVDEPTARKMLEDAKQKAEGRKQDGQKKAAA